MPEITMFLPKAAGLLLTLSVLAVGASGQSDSVPPPPPDPQIAAALRDVSALRIQQTIEKLVSFQTRHTLSSDVPSSAGHGINAAAEWIKSEFESYSKACGGCLEVKNDQFTQDPGNRIPQPTKLTNVYAILRGSDAPNASRIVLVTGHYDSRNSETNDATAASPGANDDGSGTAVSMECARVLSQHKFPATIIFLTVAGEEQGLYGSAHFAKMAKAQGWNIEAVLNNDIVGGDHTPGDTKQDTHTVRVFSEGIPVNATEAELKMIRALGGENDGASRQLARYIAAVSREYVPSEGLSSSCGVPPRPLFTWGRPHFVQRTGLRGRTVHGVSRELRSPAPERTHREWRRVRRPSEIRKLRLRGKRRARKRRDISIAGFGPSASGQSAGVDEGPGKRFHSSVGGIAWRVGHRIPRFMARHGLS